MAVATLAAVVLASSFPAPLKQATDAIAIDSTHKSLEEVVGEMSLVVREYLKK
jgi:cytidylate kinase